MTEGELRKMAENYERAAQVVETHFPGAMTSQEVLKRVTKVIEKIGCIPEK
jgi:hypothetical protein